MKRFLPLVAFVILAAVPVSKPTPRDLSFPKFAHIFVIIEENKDYGEVIDSKDAPAISALAHTYGYATNFFGETHPSEPNYVALVGGYTFGIQDDDAFYCKPHDTRMHCGNANSPGYPNHTIYGPSLATQLDAAGLPWKNYNDGLPAPGSLAIVAAEPNAKNVPGDILVYASKHSGFLNYKTVQDDPHRAQKLVGFDQLHADLTTGKVPAFSLIIPNLCDDMHGVWSPQASDDCKQKDKLIWRGDQLVKSLVHEIMTSPVWNAKEHSAIVITFDENSSLTYVGCCGNDPTDPANRGGGRIPMVVVTNHGPRGVVDATPYNHYSLLRTIEDAFGTHDYLRKAASPGVVPMTKLFTR